MWQVCCSFARSPSFSPLPLFIILFSFSSLLLGRKVLVIVVIVFLIKIDNVFLIFTIRHRFVLIGRFHIHGSSRPSISSTQILLAVPSFRRPSAVVVVVVVAVVNNKSRNIQTFIVHVARAVVQGRVHEIRRQVEVIVVKDGPRPPIQEFEIVSRPQPPFDAVDFALLGHS